MPFIFCYYKQSYNYEATTGRVDRITGRVDRITGRMSGMTTQVDYSYLSNANLLSGISVTNGSATTYQTVSYGYESDRDLLSHVVHKNGAGTKLSRFEYQYDEAGRRLQSYATGAHYDAYPRAALLRSFEYNDRSELTKSREYFASNDTDYDYAIRGRIWDYGFDNAGNRTRYNDHSWTNNGGNQLTRRNVPGEVTASGLAVSGTASADRITLKAVTDGSMGNYVTLEQIQANSTVYAPAYRYGNYFRAEVDVDNSSGPVYAEMSIFATDISQNKVALEAPAGSTFVPKAQEVFVYDDAGNLIEDGRWDYAFDSENRLIVPCRIDVIKNAKLLNALNRQCF